MQSRILAAQIALGNFFRSTSGNSGVEYALITAGIAIAILAVVFTAGNSVEKFFAFLANELQSAAEKAGPG